MFRDTEAFSSFAVDDVDRARSFYADTLGLKTSEPGYGLLVLELAGERPTMIYPRPGHEPAAYTVLNFRVEDIDAAVDALEQRGVELARFEGFGQDERGIAREDGPLIAWFRDPAGNILSVVQDAPAGG